MVGPRRRADGIRPAPNPGIGIAVVGAMGNTNASFVCPFGVAWRFFCLVILVDWCPRRPFFGNYSRLVHTPPPLLLDVVIAVDIW